MSLLTASDVLRENVEDGSTCEVRSEVSMLRTCLLCPQVTFNAQRRDDLSSRSALLLLDGVFFVQRQRQQQPQNIEYFLHPRINTLWLCRCTIMYEMQSSRGPLQS